MNIPLEKIKKAASRATLGMSALAFDSIEQYIAWATSMEEARKAAYKKLYDEPAPDGVRLPRWSDYNK